MSAEAAGFALADALYRRQALVLGEEKLVEAGERLVKHLKRRGYVLVYDPAMYDPLPEQFMKADPVEVTRLNPVGLPDGAERWSMPAKTLEIDGRDVRCLDCGCFTFYVWEGSATCTGCKATYRVRSEG